MDLSRKTFSNHNYTRGLYPPDLPTYFEGFAAFEEYDTNRSTVFPSLSFIKNTLLTVSEQQTTRATRRHLLEHLVGRLWHEKLPGKKHAEHYLRHQHRRNCRPNTIRNSYHTISSFLGFIKKAGKLTIEKINRGDIEAFIEGEQDRGLKLSTVRTRLQILKAFVRYLNEEKIIDHDVFPWKMTIKPPQSLPRAMDPDEVKRLLSVIDHIRDRTMILVLLRTGMRIGELLATTVSDVNLKERKILIFESEKNRLGRVVYFTDDARDAVKAWLTKRDPKNKFLFYGHRGRPLTYPAARMVFVKCLEKAGLSHKNSYTLHCLRHTFATELLNAGMRLECLEKLMGHTSLEVTRRYARLTDKTREEEYFKAMAIIERGEINGYYGLDRELQEVFEEKELLSSHSEELPEHP